MKLKSIIKQSLMIAIVMAVMKTPEILCSMVASSAQKTIPALTNVALPSLSNATNQLIQNITNSTQESMPDYLQNSNTNLPTSYPQLNSTKVPFQKPVIHQPSLKSNQPQLPVTANGTPDYAKLAQNFELNVQTPSTKPSPSSKFSSNATNNNPFSKSRSISMQRPKVYDFSVRGFKSMIDTSLTPELKNRYGLNPKSDGTYEPDWFRLILDDKIEIIKSFIKANLVTDKISLLDKTLRNSDNYHDILEFYKNDFNIINKHFTNIFIEPSYWTDRISIENIKQLLQTGISNDLKLQASIGAAKRNEYNLVKLFNPAWFTQEFIHQKEIIRNAKDISQEQKSKLFALYDSATINANPEDAAYDLSESQLEQIIPTIGLTISQIIKYMPFQLFNIQRIADIIDTTTTARMLLKFSPNLKFSNHSSDNEYPYAGRSNEASTLNLFNKGIFDQIINIEKQMEPQGYHTFVTGRKWSFNFSQDIWNLIKAVKSKNNKMRSIVELNPNKYESDVQYLKIKRDNVLKDSAYHHSSVPGACLNSTLLENIHDDASFYTPQYFHNNSSRHFQGQSEKDIFQKFDMMQLYKKYEPELTRLKDLHEASNHFGEIIAVSIRNDKIDSLTYLATDSKSHSKETCKPSKMLERLYDQSKSKTDKNGFYNSDEPLFYFLPLPDLPGENGRDYKMNSIHVADPEKFAEYKKEMQQLFETMKNDPAMDAYKTEEMDAYCKEFITQS